MKLFLNSQIYFLASILLHAGIFLFLVLSSYSFSRNNDTFEASVMFETPEPPAPMIQPKTTVKTTKPAKKEKSAEPVKPIAAPKLKSPTISSPSSGSSYSPSITNKRLDDILKNKTPKTDPEKKTVDPVVEKKSDLLGYLRANKRTKEQTAMPETPPKPEKPVPAPKPAETPKPEPPTAPQQPAQAPAQDEAGRQKTEQPEIADSLSGDNKTTNTGKPSALSVWRKKKEIQSYRSILRQLVTANWTVPPVAKKKFQIMVEATIDKNGNLVRIQLLESSGLAILDAAAERAIRVSTPFPNIPETLEQENPEFTAVFRFTPDQVVY